MPASAPTDTAPPSTAAAELGAIMAGRQLQPHFQPIVDLAQGTIHGHESLIRGPGHSPLHNPAALFREARQQGCHAELELLSAQLGAASFAAQAVPGALFLNLSATALLAHWETSGDRLPQVLLDGSGLAPTRVVVELTEQDPVACRLPRLTQALAALRAQGVRFALDDYGVGHSSLQLWVETRPDLVKIDRYFCHGISRDDGKQKLVRLMLSAAQALDTPLLAEGIETEEDLLAVRDLGVRYAQGWHLGRPVPLASGILPPCVRAGLAASPQA